MSHRVLGAALDSALERWPTDIAKCGFLDIPGEMRRWEKGEFTDAWGCVWSNVFPGLLGSVTGHPLAGDIDLSDWRSPRGVIGPAIGRLPSQIAAAPPDQFRLGGSMELFHRMCWLRPMDQLMMDLFMAPDRFEALLAAVAAHFDEVLAGLLSTELDAVLIVDDWGTQTSTFIRPDDWRRLFKPVYRRWVEETHRAGKMMFMHSDGMILSIIPDIDEIGVDALNCEVDCMGLDAVAEARGSLCLWGELDRQNLLPRGTPEEVYAAALRYRERLDHPEGGVILQSEIGPDVPVENLDALIGAWGAQPPVDVSPS